MNDTIENYKYVKIEKICAFICYWLLVGAILIRKF